MPFICVDGVRYGCALLVCIIGGAGYVNVYGQVSVFHMHQWCAIWMCVVSVRHWCAPLVFDSDVRC